MPKTQVLFINFGQREALRSLKAIQQLREIGISAELFPDAVKMKKQFNYADRRAVPYVGIIGESELANNEITIKEMSSGKQETKAFDDFVSIFQSS